MQKIFTANIFRAPLQTAKKFTAPPFCHENFALESTFLILKLDICYNKYQIQVTFILKRRNSAIPLFVSFIECLQLNTIMIV